MDSNEMLDPSTTIPSRCQLLGTLKESVKEVFDSMVITFSEAALEKGIADDARPTLAIETTAGVLESEPVVYQSSVEFHGPLEGRVILSFSAHGATDVANVLLMAGEDEVLADAEVADALGECANLVTGVLKTKALDPVAAFTVGVPDIVGPGGAQREIRTGSLAYKLSEGLMSVEIWLT